MSEITRFDEDFEFTFDVLESFFKQGRVQRALKAIKESWMATEYPAVPAARSGWPAWS